MPKEQGLHIIIGMGAIVFIILGAILVCFLLSGIIVLPLYWQFPVRRIAGSV